MANTTNFNWETPDDTDLVKDGAAAIRTLGNSIDTSLVDLKGGTTGQILSKASNSDLDYTWIANDVGDITNVGVTAPITGGGSSGSVTIGIDDGTTAQKGAVQLEDSTSSTSTTKAATPNSVKSAYDLANAAIPKSLVDAAGDLIYATADNTVARLALGTAGQVLKVNSGATAPEWAAAGGSVTFAGCLAYRVTTATIPGSTNTAITLTAEQYDTDGYHSNSTNTSRLTIPSGKAGYYQIVANITTATTTSANSIAIYINGTRYVSNDFTGNSGNEGKNISIIAYLAVNDYVEMFYSNGSGSALTVYGSTDTGDQSTSLAIGFLGA